MSYFTFEYTRQHIFTTRVSIYPFSHILSMDEKIEALVTDLFNPWCVNGRHVRPEELS